MGQRITYSVKFSYILRLKATLVHTVVSVLHRIIS